MASKTPSPALAALVTRSYPIEADVWADFWQRLAAKELHPGEAVAVLSSLTTQMPDGASVSALLGSLRAGNPQPAAPARTPSERRGPPSPAEPNARIPEADRDRRDGSMPAPPKS